MRTGVVATITALVLALSALNFFYAKLRPHNYEYKAWLACEQVADKVVKNEGFKILGGYAEVRTYPANRTTVYGTPRPCFFKVSTFRLLSNGTLVRVDLYVCSPTIEVKD